MTEPNEVTLLQNRVQALENLLSSLIFSDRYIFQKNVQVMDGRNFQFAKGTGSTFGTETSQKIGFYGKTTTQAGAINAPSGGTTIDSASRTAITSIIAALHNMGITA